MSKLIKISKLAKDLGVTRQTLYNWRIAGKLEVVKSPGGHNFVTEDTYNSLLNIKKPDNDDNL